MLHTFSLTLFPEIEVSIEMRRLLQCMLVSASVNTFSLKLTVFFISFSLGLSSKLSFQLILRSYGKLIAAYCCFHKLEYIFYEVNPVFHKLTFPIKIEILIGIIPCGKLMEAYGCFHKPKCICYEARHAFYKLSIRFASSIELLTNTMYGCFNNLKYLL